MRKLLESIPTTEEWEKSSEEEKDIWLFTIRHIHDKYCAHNVDTEHHPAERLAMVAACQPFVFDLIVEFDLAIDYNA